MIYYIGSENVINVFIDEFTPCLKDAKTGELVETEVVRIRRKSFLRKYNKKNGWFTNWEDLTDENEIYALVVQGSVDVQGLVAISPKKNMGAMYITWMCVAPQNNKLLTDEIKYYGVGGHLFAIAARKSMDDGYGGFMYGFASNRELLNHYVKQLKAETISILHPYHFAIDEENAKHIVEVYDYVWTDEEI